MKLTRAQALAGGAVIVIEGTPAGAAAATGTCTYPGANLPVDSIGFQII